MNPRSLSPWTVTFGAIFILGGAVATAAPTPASFTGVYTQNFDSLGNTGTSLDTGALQGWSVTGSTGEGSASNVQVTTGQVVILSNTTPGTSTTGGNPGGQFAYGLHNYGTDSSYLSGNSGDRALGSRAGSNGFGNHSLDLRLTNNTGQAITSFSLTYDGEVWINSGASGFTMYYSTTGLANSWTLMGSTFNFAPTTAYPAAGSPAGNGENEALDGNLSANRNASIGGVYTPTEAIAAGSTFYLRWYDGNDGGTTDRGVAIDNVLITAVPEPTALALLGGLGMFTAFSRRNRRKVG